VTDPRLGQVATYLDHWLGYRLRHLQIPGMVAAFAQDGELLLHAAYGLADVETGAAMTPGHVFPIASHSKTFTTVVVLRLVERGVLRLDDQLAQWLPELPSDLATVQLGELLSHSGGITRDSRDSDFWLLDKEFPTSDRLRQMAEAVLGRHERFKYSNIGFGLAGAVIEAACGASYDEVARREVLEPLSLRDTSTDTTDRDCATGYSARAGGQERRPLSVPSAGALAAATGYCSTAADLVTFATALCDDRVLSADTLRVMTHIRWVGEYGDQDYCLGVSHTMVGERHVYGHGGAYPGFITTTRLDPQDRLVTVVLTNAIDGPAGELSKTMLALADYALQCEPGKASDDVTGRYGGLWGRADVVALGERLVCFDPDLPDPLERRMELERTGDTWTITRSSGYGVPGEQVTFEGDRARVGGMTMQREARW
jgi:CubicO group peptidase (beta-lactamase class C family)